MQISSPKTQALVNRISRFSPVVFLRRYILLIAFLLFFLISNIVGLWNVRNIEFGIKEDSNVNISTLGEYVEEIKGKNIFLVTPSEVEEKLNEYNGFVKSINVEKRIPSTLYIQIEEYEPKFLGYASQRCKLFSEEGVRIVEICKECEEECVQYTDIYPSIYISSNSSLENSRKLIYTEEIVKGLEILKVFGYEIISIDILNGIARFEGIDNHIFIFDISENLEIQLNRMYIVGKKINDENMNFRSLDLRFERPVMKLE
ncbi:hypothetical protein CVU76_01855 [Candidatus Dojkabacteria bacterium HGW-Dojkabacteria-1]|uniref:POTRA domain-containing protein n=1 Tax=Candidatus Dojkabacteria bacterium HGW-Dojkabacteria-1 TaxID=2013761 RepID=A0A2N2F3K4_9BACT|nr:MAG: hypothetical protein CVU76_01855 [Candidatus Dojkabacteria bacterium HGW-Dojkabacteria-1]